MAEAVPQIRVTDIQDQESKPIAPSPTPSPLKNVVSDERSPKTARESAGDSRSEARGLSGPAESPDRNAPDAGHPNGHNPQNLFNGDRRESQPIIDPLSEQILKRTNVQMPTTLRSTYSQADGAPVPLSASSTGTFSIDSVRGDNASRDKKKGVSFLSRFISTKKKDAPEKFPEFDAESRDERPEGMDAELFAQPLDNIGFNPHHLQPPGYIKVRSHNKKEKEFDRLFLAQELRNRDSVTKSRQSSSSNLSSSRRTRTINTDAVWAMEFSKDGKYLAAGGQDKTVRIWAVLSSREERKMHEKAEDAGDETSDQHTRLSAPVFQSRPIREYEGHTAAVLDLSWSKNNFLLSSSMDKTVRLWHVIRTECLCAFKHNDLVTSIQFHPRDDRFFLAGCLDSKVRLWSIPDKSVAFWNQVPEMITAVSFTPDGKSAVVGCLTGLCLFYETEGMKYQTQIHVKSTHGKNAKGSKITGIQASSLPPGSSNGDVKLLITSNDSRIRLYNLRDKSLEMKFKGNQNASMQIHARFSDDARYVICGSDDHKAYIWSTVSEDNDKNKRPVEMFEAHRTTTTVALFAPRKTRQLLGNSEDPIYDLCNPPPVTLVSKSEVDSLYSAQGQAETGSVQAPTPNPEGSTTPKRPEFSPAYIARSSHLKGNIIVTADSSGVIKVFRQDCAHDKRQSADEISLFSKRTGTSVIRKSSMATYVTNNTRSRSRGNSVNSQPSVDRVLSWRQSVSGSNSSLERTSSTYLSSVGGRGQTRSNSPKKPGGIGSRSAKFNNGDSPRHASFTHTSGAGGPNGDQLSRELSIDTEASSNAINKTDGSPPSSQTDPKPQPEFQTAPRELMPPNARPEPERVNSNVYWRRDAWKESIQDQLRGVHDQHMNDAAAAEAASRRPGIASHDTLELPLAQHSTNISALSSERGTTPSNASDLSDAADAGSGLAEAKAPADIVCAKCGGRSFKPRHRESVTSLKKGDVFWVCARCGTLHEP